MKKLLTCGVIIATMATILTVGGGTARAAICTVPSVIPAYPTIQSAVNDPACTTINVSAGFFPENVVINRTVIINGAQAGTPGPGRVGAESIVQGPNPFGGNAVFQINAANVTIDGFTVKNPITTGAAIGVHVKSVASGSVVQNNIVDGVTTADTSTNGAAQAVYLENGPDDVKITDNDLKNVSGERSSKGVFIGDAGSTNPSNDVLIARNSIENITSVARGAYGVTINNGNGANPNSGLVIEDNTISTLTGITGWVHAIGLEADTPGVSVQRNSINPLVTGTLDAIAVWFEANPSFGTAQVNENNFNVTNTAYGIAVHPAIVGTGAVDGTCNWWGAPDGPGPVGDSLIGAKVSPRVVYTPWLTAPFPIGACLGGVPSTPGKVTGGGHITGEPVFDGGGLLLSLPALVVSASSPNEKATFGFVAKCCPESGNLSYHDHAADVRIKATSIDSLHISSPGFACATTPGSQHATFTGRADVTRSSGTINESLTVNVDDCGEPGTMDTLGIKTDSYENGPKTLTGGNIQIHK